MYIKDDIKWLDKSWVEYKEMDENILKMCTKIYK